MGPPRDPAGRSVATPGNDFLISDFADDEEVIDLVEEFVGTLPCRIEALRQAFEKNDLDTIRTAAHQLKGSGGGFGFALITDAARRFESAARDRADPETLEPLVEELTRLCITARARA